MTFRGKVIITLLAALAFGGCLAGAANAAVPTWKLGANVSTFDSNGNLINVLGVGKAAPNGLGVLRFEMIEGTPSQGVLTPAMDTAVKHYALDGVALYAMLGLGPQRATNNFVNDSNTLDTYATQFMQRFGTNGTFWAQNPTVPYHPVTQVEIGNEVNYPNNDTADQTYLHYPGAGAYAYVYAHARAAIKAVNSGARVIVGGLAPLDFSTVKTWLANFLDSQYTTAVDSIGWHPYMLGSVQPTDPQTLADAESFTSQLHQLAVDHGFSTAKIDMNEFDSDTTASGSSSAWGQTAVALTQWAVCTSGYVVDVQPEWWGGVPQVVGNDLFPLVDQTGDLTPYGSDYLAETHALTTTGC